MVELSPLEKLGNLLYGGILSQFRHVIDQHESDSDVAGLELQWDGWLRSNAGGVDREDAIAAQDLSTDHEVPGKVHFDDVIDPRAAGKVHEKLRGVFRPIVDDGIGTGGQSDVSLLV